MRNQYKRRDIFICSHQTHLKFNKVVTPFHVLKKKQCYPEGCINFKYHCRQLEAGRACPRKYNFVGKNCGSCKFFFDEKIQRTPEIADIRIYNIFREELQEFEEWITNNSGRYHNFSGTVDSVRPLIEKNEIPGQESLTAGGYLLKFRSGYCGYTHIDDPCYAKISGNIMSRYCFSAGDSVDFDGILAIDEGRLLFKKLRRIDMERRTKNSYIEPDNIALSRSLGRCLTTQDEFCYDCDRGILIDVIRWNAGQKEKKRQLYCLEGVKEPELCIYKPVSLLKTSEIRQE